MAESVNFTPPIQQTEILTVSQYPDERVNGCTIEIVDSADEHFTLTMATAAKLAMDGAADAEEDVLGLLDEDREKVFVVDGNEIDPSDIEEILEGMSPQLLSRYLTHQENN